MWARDVSSPVNFRSLQALLLHLTSLTIMLYPQTNSTTVATTTTKKGKKDNKKGGKAGGVQPMRVGNKDGDSTSGSPMRTPSDGSDTDN